MSSAERIPHPDQPKPETRAQRGPEPRRWLSVEQIRKQQRCRRSLVIAAMDAGQLPYEQRGRIRYARICDVEAWELTRLTNPRTTADTVIHPDLKRFL